MMKNRKVNLDDVEFLILEELDVIRADNGDLVIKPHTVIGIPLKFGTYVGITDDEGTKLVAISKGPVNFARVYTEEEVFDDTG